MKVGISLDLYGTLVEVDTDVPTIGEELTARGFPCSPAVEEIWNSPGFDGRRTHDTTVENYENWRRTCIRRLAVLCGVPSRSVDEVTEDLLALDRSWTVRACDWATELLTTAEDYASACCILTNWDYDVVPYLRMAGLPTTLNAVVSAQTGYRKPHVAAFRIARDIMRISELEHIHVGDSWEADIVGAIQSGAWAVWITEEKNLTLPSRIIQTRPVNAPAALRNLISYLENHS